MDISIIAFKNLYELIKQAYSDIRKISSKYRKSVYLEKVFPELYNEIKTIHSDYLTTFSRLKREYWMGEIDFQQLQQEFDQLQYTNKTIRIECVSRLDVFLAEDWSEQAYSTIKAMRDYFGTTYKFKESSQLQFLKYRIDKIREIQSNPNYDSNNLRQYHPYDSGFSEAVLMFRIIEYLNTEDRYKKERLLANILRLHRLPMDSSNAKRLLKSGLNPITHDEVNRIIEELINRLNTNFSKITTCYELFKMIKRT